MRIDSILVWGIMEERCIPQPLRREHPEGTDTAVPVAASLQHTAGPYPWGCRGSCSALARSSASPARVCAAPAGAATSVLLAASSEPLGNLARLKAKSTLQWAEFKTGLGFLTLASDLGATAWVRGKEG